MKTYLGGLERPNHSSEGISVRYIYSACVVTSSVDVTVLHDPWFTDGIYDGSWFHFPVVQDPITSIGNVDLIYVSHVHPDHYDPVFLKQYFAVHGRKEILIADHQPNYLASKMRADGFTPTILKEAMVVGSTLIEIIPHRTGSISDIDSAIVVKCQRGRREHCIVNANDVIFDDTMIKTMQEIVHEPDILLCGYTGAGPYPQTYFDIDDPELLLAAQNKKQAFFERYLKLVAALNPKVTIPFAGKYLLGGKLTPLNPYRGVADPTEILEFDPNAVVLEDSGGEISTLDLKPTGVRTSAYREQDVQQREAEIANYKFDYERLFSEGEIHQLPLKRLLNAAARKANLKSECVEDYFFAIKLPNDVVAILNAKRGTDPTIEFRMLNECDRFKPRSEINIDPRYLFGLLTGIYHWNNAEVGSQYATRRYPNRLNRAAQSYLHFLVV